MKSILNKCTESDFHYISTVLNSYVPFTNDKQRDFLLKKCRYIESARDELVDLIDRQIKYFGSTDLGYCKRLLFGEDNDSEHALKIIEAVYKKLGIQMKLGGTVESQLKTLAEAVVEKELHGKSPEELSKSFLEIGVGNADVDLIMEHLSTGTKAAILPVLIQVLGKTATIGIIEAIISCVIEIMVGSVAAVQIAKTLIQRNPWLNALGPIVWTLSATWMAYELQGPAYRKTVPICLYLGVVALRDGEEIETSSSKKEA